MIFFLLFALPVGRFVSFAFPYLYANQNKVRVSEAFPKLDSFSEGGSRGSIFIKKLQGGADSVVERVLSVREVLGSIAGTASLRGKKAASLCQLWGSVIA